MAQAMNLKSIAGLTADAGVNIMDVVVPPELDAVVETGIGFLDDAFGGEGITPSTVAVITGDPGAGKSTLMLQLAESLSKKGHQCVYNSREESIEQIKKVTRRLGFQKGFIVGQERNVPNLIKQMDLLRKREIAKLDKQMTEFVAANPGLPPPDLTPPRQILIVDSLQSHEDGKYADGGINSNTAVRVTEQLTDWAKETYGIVFIIGQVTKGGKVAGKQQIIHTLDVHAHLTIERDSENEFFGCRLFGVLKNRFGCNGITYALDLSKYGFMERGQIGGLTNDNDNE